MTEWAAQLEDEAAYEAGQHVDDTPPTVEDLIGLARTHPDLDLTDLELTPSDVMALRAELAAIRGACDTASRALAAAWIDWWGQGSAISRDRRLYATVAPSRGAWRIVDPEGFARWLLDQPADTVAKVVSGIRVGSLDGAIRDTFLDQTIGNPTLTVSAVDGLPPKVAAFADRLDPDMVVG